MHLFNRDIKKRFTQFDLTLPVLSLVGLFFALFTLTYSQAEDMGQFLSQTALLANGQRLYRDVWEIKDPLFFLISTISTLLIGRIGPYIADAVAVAASAPISYLALRSIRIKKLGSAIGAVFFVGSISGTYFQSFRTGTICLVVIVLSIVTINKKKYFLSGVLFALVLMLKMPYIPFLICPIAMAFQNCKSYNFLFRIFAGSMSTLSIIAGSMLLRGELVGYFQMIQENFRYQKLYPEIVGFKSGLSGHVAAVNGSGSSVRILFFTVFASWLLTLIVGRKESRTVILSLVLLQISVLIVVLSTTMWVHHLQMLSLLGFATYALVASVNWTSSINDARAFVCFLLLLINLQVTGFRFPINSKQSLATIHSPIWTMPPEVASINQNLQSSNERVLFARFGPNDDLGLASFLPKTYQLVCNNYAQYGHENIEWITEIVTCVRDKPDVVFVSSGFYALSRPTGDYELLKTEAKKVLEEKFNCIAVENREGSFLCVRRNSQLEK